MNRHALVLVTSITALAAACSPGSTQSTGSTTPAPSSPAPSSEAPASEAPASSPPPAAAQPTLPPSGEYDLTVETTADTCNPSAAAPFTQRITLATHPRDASAIMNIPLVVGPPARVLDGGVAIPQIGFERSDVLLTAGDTHPNSLHPIRNCPAYGEDTTLTVTDVSHDRVRLTRTRVFGNASTCPAQTPRGPRVLSNCRQELAYTLTLVHAACELPCSGVIHPADGGVMLECSCGH